MFSLGYMYKSVRFSGSRVLSPVCCLESCDLDTDSYRDGSRRQLRLWRMSTDINLMKIVLDMCCWYMSSELGGGFGRAVLSCF